MSTATWTDAQITQILRYCGYPARAAFGYIIGGSDMATAVVQINAMSAAEQAQIVGTLLPNLVTLETAVQTTTATLNVASAGPFTRNSNELQERIRQYTWARRQLCAFIGVSPGDALSSGGRIVRA